MNLRPVTLETVGTSPTEVGLAAGEVLFYQGAPSGDFFVLREGAVEVLISENENLKGEALLDASRRVAVIETPGSPIGEIGAILDEPRTATVRAARPSRLLRIPAHGRAFRAWLSENPRISRVIARALAERIRRTEARSEEILALTRDAGRLLDGYALNYLLLCESEGMAPPEGFEKVLARGKEVRAILARDGGAAERPSLAFSARAYRPPTSDAGAFGGIPGGTVGGAYDAALVRFLSDAVHDDALGGFFEARPERILFVIERLASTFPVLNARLKGQIRQADRLLRALAVGGDSVGAALARLAGGRAAALPFAERFAEDLEGLRGQMVELLGRFPEEADALLARIRESAEAASKEGGAVAAVVPKQGVSGPRNADVLTAVLRLDVSAGVRERFPKALQAASEGDADAARLAAKLYWEIAPEVFKALLTERRDEWVWFLRYGLAFDGAWTPERLAKVPTEPGRPGPVLYIDDWLGKIYRGEVPPSRNELGLTYAEAVADRPGNRWSEEENDPAMDLVRYEIASVLSAASRAASGGRAGSLPCITSPEALDGKIVEPGVLAKAVVEVLQIDFTAFYREVRVLLGARSEFLPREVIPHFLIIPAAGGRGVPWQEYEGKSKETPGRIFIPLRVEGDFREVVIETIGRFRWMLARAVAGPSWADPVEGGLTGKYLDYIQFYKKNPDLTEEQKEKIAEEWRGLSLDADKFVRDYVLWVKYESNGVQKLNKVVRRLFCDLIPFAKPVREALAKNPAFSEILRKDSNRREKKRIEILRRMQKLENDGVDVGNAFDGAFKVFDPISVE